jgi:hypothetical protein
MSPCLADTGSTLPLTFIAIAIVAIGAGAALYFMARNKKKRAMGTTTLALVLFGALAIGFVPSTPAHADTGTDQCTQSTPTPVTTATATPTATTTPTATPTPTPTPTCTPAQLSDTVEMWTLSREGTIMIGALTDETLIGELTLDQSYSGHVVVTDGTDTTFDGDVTFTAADLDGDGTVYISIPTAQFGDDEPASGSMTLTFEIPGASADCPTQVAVTGEIAMPE